eukprot:7197095-Lingulodinium_polyedra.AAC.1
MRDQRLQPFGRSRRTGGTHTGAPRLRAGHDRPGHAGRRGCGRAPHVRHWAGHGPRAAEPSHPGRG